MNITNNMDYNKPICSCLLKKIMLNDKKGIIILKMYSDLKKHYNESIKALNLINKLISLRSLYSLYCLMVYDEYDYDGCIVVLGFISYIGIYNIKNHIEKKLIEIKAKKKESIESFFKKLN